jgi:hypothetical protein
MSVKPDNYPDSAEPEHRWQPSLYPNSQALGFFASHNDLALIPHQLNHPAHFRHAIS